MQAPCVSIVMPTFNRVDTIRRAIESVQKQTFGDWELIVVDDGSQDGTAQAITGMDSRMRLFQQPNQGVAVARNTGLANARGQFIAFLDSDDEWLPFHLELSLAFLNSHPEEAFVSNETWEYFGDGKFQKHHWMEIAQWYTVMANQVGSHRLDLPPGETDDYLRVYSSREPIGDWGRAIVERSGYASCRHYSGDIFQHFRWGFLMFLQGTVLRRSALDKVGFFDTRYWNASDYGFTAKLCKHFRANYLSIPGTIKHEYTEDGALPAETHLATGKSQLIFAKDLLLQFEELFAADLDSDPELVALRSLAVLYVAKISLRQGRRADALAHLREASRISPSPRASVLKWIVSLTPNDQAAEMAGRLIYRTSVWWNVLAQRAASIAQRRKVS